MQHARPKTSDELLADASYDDPDEVLLSQLAALDRSLGPNRASNQNRKERRACFKATKLKRPDRSRKEATATDQKKYLKDCLEAKLKEDQSWVDNDVFELVDLRKVACKNFVRGRWVLTIKRDKDGNFVKVKADGFFKDSWISKRINNKLIHRQHQGQVSVWRVSSQPTISMTFTILILRLLSSKVRLTMSAAMSFANSPLRLVIHHTLPHALSDLLMA